MEKFHYKTLMIQKSGAVTVVTLNRPEKANAINLPLLLDLKKLGDDLRTDLKTRTVIITGAGKVFSAGADISKEAQDQWYEDPQPNYRLYQRNGQDIIHALENLDQITIAAINGPAVGAGLGIATSCDLRIASENAFISIPEVSLGSIYNLSCTNSLLNLVGPANAKRLIFTCDRINAQEALAMGLVDKVVPLDRLMDSAMEMAEKIASMDYTAVRVTKKMINAASIAKTYDLSLVETELVGAIYQQGALEEGMRAYREKRQPHFPEERPQFPKD